MLARNRFMDVTMSFICITMSTAPAHGFEYPNVTFAHIHMAKTGGTVLNEMVANRFERVCGHKGYSFDFYKSNEMHVRMDTKHLNR